MKLPRDISGLELAKAPQKLGYKQTRQTGSHIRLPTVQPGEHHQTIPNHPAIRVGTRAKILRQVAGHSGTASDDIAQKIFD